MRIEQQHRWYVVTIALRCAVLEFTSNTTGFYSYRDWINYESVRICQSDPWHRALDEDVAEMKNVYYDGDGTDWYWENKRVLSSVPGETDVFKTWGPAFKISFNVQMKNNLLTSEGELLNLFHITSTNTDCCELGSRIAAVWFHRGEGPDFGRKNYMRVATTLSGSNKYYDFEVPKGKWLFVVIEHKSYWWSKGIFRLRINDQLVMEHKTIWTRHNNVIWYMSNPWTSSPWNQHVLVKNVIFQDRLEDNSNMMNC